MEEKAELNEVSKIKDKRRCKIIVYTRTACELTYCIKQVYIRNKHWLKIREVRRNNVERTVKETGLETTLDKRNQNDHEEPH